MIAAVILALCVAAAVVMAQFGLLNGEVIFRTTHTTVSLSIVEFIFAAVVCAIAVYGVIFICMFGARIPKRIRAFFKGSKERRAQKAFHTALALLGETQWGKAEKLLAEHAEHTNMPTVCYLCAAFAANEQQAVRRAEHFLRLAKMRGELDDNALLLWQARLAAWRGDGTETVQLLEKLTALTPKNTFVQRLLLNAYREQKNWQGIRHILQKIGKHTHTHSALEQKTYRSIAIEAAVGSLHDAIHLGNIQAVTTLWQKMPQTTRGTTEVLLAYVKALVALDATDTAEQALRVVLRQSDERALFLCYAALPTDVRFLHTQITKITEHSHNVWARLCLAQLSLRLGNFSEARKHMTGVLRDRPDDIDAWRMIADLCDKTDDTDGALQAYREVARLTGQKHEQSASVLRIAEKTATT